MPDTNVFNGSVTEINAHITWGGGYGVSAVSFNSGKAVGVNNGMTGWIGAGVSEHKDKSEVISQYQKKLL